MKSVLIMMVGLSGSGKSWEADKISKLLKAEVVSSDSIRAELYGDINDQSHNHEVFNEAHRRITNLLKEEKRVIYDATNVSSKRRRNFLKTIEHIDCFKECVIMATPYEICLEQNTKRDRQIPEYVIKRQLENFNVPQYSEGWDYICVRHNFAGDYNVDDELEKNRIPHDNPHHKLGVLNHMLMADYIYTMNYEYKKDVRETILYHDIGKYLVKSFANYKGEPTTIAHYYNHHRVSAYLYLCDYKKYNDNEQDALYICFLIEHHMDLYMTSLNSLLDKYDKTVIEDLCAIYNCDKAAH